MTAEKADRDRVMRQAIEDAERTRDVNPGADARRRNRGSVLSVRLNEGEQRALEAAAEKAALPVSTLVRAWIVEHLRGTGGPVSAVETELSRMLALVVREAVREELAPHPEQLADHVGGGTKVAERERKVAAPKAPKAMGDASAGKARSARSAKLTKPAASSQ
ncbi:hypothetical protein [Microbacterium sp.]|uniref:hypothetical protein n=1 Tax=Microbacterium sp. TaxID=51671 RepID=UPI0027364BA5|nr:hypothetical protein [Microbacterium sp.]MDP3951945.1 hypothetical protein [Microbacterium sp.]